MFLPSCSSYHSSLATFLSPLVVLLASSLEYNDAIFRNVVQGTVTVFGGHNTLVLRSISIYT
jgi:hypothetical protein